MKTEKLTFENPAVAIKLTLAQAEKLGISKEENQKGILKTSGMWQIPVSFKALCCTAIYKKEYYTKCIKKSFYGIRTMTNARNSGYVLEGQVSIKGKKYSCFTSDQLFEIEGKLINVSTIHARLNK